MKKKVSDQDVARFIRQIADKLLGEMDYDLRVAESQMDIAEKDLADTFTNEQKVLYDEFCKKDKCFLGLRGKCIKEKFKKATTVKKLDRLSYRAFLCFFMLVVFLCRLPFVVSVFSLLSLKQKNICR